MQIQRHMRFERFLLGAKGSSKCMYVRIYKMKYKRATYVLCGGTTILYSVL
jgi:hypothetical protein